MQRKIQRPRHERRATATVELAVVMIVLLPLLLGMIEYGWVLSVKQAMIAAAREGARTAALPGSTEDDVLERISEQLHPMGLTTYDVELLRSTPEDPREQVNISIPYDDVTLVGRTPLISNLGLDELHARVVMKKEGY